MAVIFHSSEDINIETIGSSQINKSISYSNVSLAFCKNSGDKQSYLCSSLLDAPTEYNNILKFKMTALVKRTPHGPSRLRFYLVLDGIRHYSDYYDVYTYFTTINYEQDVRPDNGEPWTNDDLDYIEVGMEGAV